MSCFCDTFIALIPLTVQYGFIEKSMHYVYYSVFLEKFAIFKYTVKN